MNRPASVKSDNIFVMLFNALRLRRIPLVLRIVSHTLLLVVLALVLHGWIMGMQLKHAMDQHANALGQSLITQTAASATEQLVANDMLSLNVLLSNLVQNPLVAHAAIHSVDNRVLAEAGTAPRRHLLDDQGIFSTSITIQEAIAGRLSISLDMQQFHQPMSISLQNMGLLSLILLALTLILSLRLGRRISLPLMQLRVWLRDPDFPAPGAGRQDEIGELARQLQTRLLPEPEVREEEDEQAPLDDTEPDCADDEDDDPSLGKAPTPSDRPAPAPLPTSPATPQRAEKVVSKPTMPIRTAVLAVQLGGQERIRALPAALRQELLQRHRDGLDQVATLYRADLQMLKDGSGLILFNSRGNEQNFLTHAICCGELLRAQVHCVQSDLNEPLPLQLGLSQGTGLAELSQGDLLLSEPVQAALGLSQHSRNLLLVESSVGEDALVRQRARVRRVAKPAGASAIEGLQAPYPALLERQLAHLQEAQHRV
ncbi:histidine kinase [Stutzerimonas tarimensis]|uniref:Histidine kinase n=1 Tax=Stutzerimonas tarimensis TaxID=1507735 RepID=A0ABV7T480_9GAMM